MKLEYTWTQDNLRLMGAHYPVNDDTCVLEVHGMSGNFIENYYANVLGEKLSTQGYGFIYGHNRGYCHVNDIATKPINPEDNSWNYTRLGVTYELFEDSPKDIAAWVATVSELGYKRIILLGHSLGCNKIIYYLSKNPNANIAGVILASPPDLVGSAKSEKYTTSHNTLYTQAQELVTANKPRQLLDGMLWDWYEMSAQTYLSLFSEEGLADNLPVLRNPLTFEQLATIQQPILNIVGEHDDIKIRDLNQDMELIRSKATACPDFQIQFIEGASHNYENREDAFASVISEWVKGITLSP